MKFSIEEIIKVTEGNLINGSPNGCVDGVSIDSRTIKSGELFVAIKGARFDGHNFLGEAVSKGARAALVSQRVSESASQRVCESAGLRVTAHSHAAEIRTSEFAMIEVSDTVRALNALAGAHRARFDIPVIGITGSNGKTTMKELTANLLSRRFKVLKNDGTENNAIGLGLTLLRLTSEHEAAALELGMNRLGEIRMLAQILQPTIGIITNVGPSHLEYLGSIENVLRAKCELIEVMGGRGTVIINGDDALLRTVPHQMSFGIEHPADIQASNIVVREKGIEFVVRENVKNGVDSIFTSSFTNKNRVGPIFLNMLGRHNVYNALAAICVARKLGIGVFDMAQSLATFKSPPLRMQLVSLNGAKWILDCYNSNPLSLAWAIKAFSELDVKGRRIFVAGDMLELGNYSSRYHFEAGRMVAAYCLDLLITVGQRAPAIREGALAAGMEEDRIFSCQTYLDAADLLGEIINWSDAVMIKASRAIGLERIIDVVKTNSGARDEASPFAYKGRDEAIAI